MSILGLGNPLLDISVNTDQAFFDKYQVAAGTATLAEDKDKPMYDEIKQFPSVSYIAGGATQNSIRGVAWSNPNKNVAHFVGSVGGDDNAATLNKSATDAGVTAHYYVSDKNPTGRCAVLVNEKKERSLIADLAAANDYDPEHFNTTEIQEVLKSVSLVYSAGFFLTVSPPTMVAAAKHCLENNKTFALNLSAEFLINFFWDQMNTVLPYADYVLCNETEAAAFAEKSGWDKTDLEGAAIKLAALPKEGGKPRVVVFTQGSSPTIVATEGKATTYPVAPIQASNIIDTNGAGDAFVGGFLTGVLLGKSVDKCVAAGNYSGGAVIQREGASYPDTFEFEWN